MSDRRSASTENAHVQVELDAVLLSDIPPEPVRWLWNQRIAEGKLNLIAGDPDVGKSLLTADIASVVTKRGQWPDGSRVKTLGSVVMLCGEDGLADTLRPRIDAAGGDATRITVVPSKKVSDREGKTVRHSICLLADLDRIEAKIVELGDTRLLVIDPINVYIAGGNIDTNRDTDLRRVLTPLKEMAERTGVAVLAIAHFNKGSQQAAIYRVAGSVGLVAACRTTSAVFRDPDEPTGPRRLWLPGKNNLVLDKTGLAYVIKPSPNGAPVVSWEAEPVLITADDVLTRAANRGKKRPSPELDDAIDWLQHALLNGPRPQKEVVTEGDAAGFKGMTIRRAADRLNVQRSKTGFQGPWLWALPAQWDAAGTWAAADVQIPEIEDF
jgi:hypothetical protein